VSYNVGIFIFGIISDKLGLVFLRASGIIVYGLGLGLMCFLDFDNDLIWIAWPALATGKASKFSE